MRRARIIAPIVLLMASAACSSPDGDNAAHRPATKPTTEITRMNVAVADDMPGLGLSDNYSRSGFDINLYQWLGEHSDPPFTPVAVPTPVEQRIADLVVGRVDMVVEAFSITDARREQVAFAGPYLKTKQGVLVRAGERGIRTIADLSGKSVCTLAGSTSLQRMSEGALRSHVQIVEEIGIRPCVDRLLAGEIDAVSTDQLILYGFAHDDPMRLVVVRNLIFGTEERYGVGLRHSNVDQCEALIRKIKQFIVDGYWDRFFETNFGDLERPSDFRPDPYNLDSCDEA